MYVSRIRYLVNLAPNRHQFRVLTQSFGTKSQTVDNQIETVNVFETVDGFLNDFSAQVFKSVEQIFKKPVYAFCSFQVQIDFFPQKPSFNELNELLFD